MNNKLNAKDLINVGIYTALYLATTFVVGMLNAFPIMHPISYFYIPIIAGIPVMLFLTKVSKFGMVSIMATLLGMAWFIMGYTWVALVAYIVAGVIADLIYKSGDYKSLIKIILGYWVFSCGAIGLQLPMWIMADAYFTHVREVAGDTYANGLLKYMPWWMGVAGIFIILAGSVIGVFLGRKLLKKHFEKAGIV